MTNTIEVGNHLLAFTFESISEDLDGSELLQVENPLAHEPIVDNDISLDVQCQRVESITENLINAKRLSDISLSDKPIDSATTIAGYVLESDSVFSLKNVKEFFLKLLRTLVTLGKAIWNKIRQECRKFLSGLFTLTRNLHYMHGLFKELAEVTNDDNFTKEKTITFGNELRYLTTDDTTFDPAILVLELDKINTLLSSVRQKVLPALNEISSHISRVILDGSEQNDPLALLDNIQQSLGKANANEQFSFVHVPITDFHPLLAIVPDVGELTRQRSPFIQGEAVASEPLLGNVRIYFRERVVTDKEKKSKQYPFELFNRVKAYQELSIQFKRPGGAETSIRSMEKEITVNVDPRPVFTALSLAIKLSNELKEIVADRNINFVNNQANLIERNLERMGDVLNDPSYSADSMEALKVLTGYVSFMNNVSVFPFQDMSILLANITNAVGVYSRKVFASYQVKE